MEFRRSGGGHPYGGVYKGQLAPGEGARESVPQARVVVVDAQSQRHRYVPPPLPLSTLIPHVAPGSGILAVFRHADRTPKQKLKFNFPVSEPWTEPFVRLLNGENEEIILREAAQLRLIAVAIDEAKARGAGGDDLAKLSQLHTALFKKIDLPGTKAQLKPGYKKGRWTGKGVRPLDKLQLVFKWGGEVRRAISFLLLLLIFFFSRSFWGSRLLVFFRP